MAPLHTTLNDMRTSAKSKPWAFYPVASLKLWKRDRLVARDTDIVIEGFPRSANSFAVEAFLSCQTRPVKVAHHFHAAAQVILGARWGIPSIVLIRNPADAVLSSMIFEPAVAAESHLRQYTAFYDAVFPYKSQFVTAQFEDTVSDLGAVVRRVNAKFGTRFEVFNHNEDNVSAVFSRLDRTLAELGYGVDRGPQPDQHRDDLKSKAKDQLSSPTVAGLLAAADELYRRFVDQGEYA